MENNRECATDAAARFHDRRSLMQQTERYMTMTIETTELGAELVSAALDSIGVEKQEIIDRREDVEQFLEANRKHWDFVEDEMISAFSDTPRIRIYLPESDAGRKKLEEVQEKLSWLAAQDFGFDIGTLETAYGSVNNEDWANNWRKYFKPFPVGDRLIVCPEWERVQTGGEDRKILYIDPGMVFGSGTHETTSLCLENLSQIVRGGERVLDAGCGSGILSIGAILFGAKEALGVDIDDAARHVVQHNAQCNGIGQEQLKVLIGDINEDEEIRTQIGGGYDILCSNIIADVIIALSRQASGLVRTDGYWLASGIILEREKDVAAAMEKAGFEILKIQRKGEWVAILTRRKEDAQTVL